jgi:UDP-N-acetylmuramate dehydrogenase
MSPQPDLQKLRAIFGDRLSENVSLKRYTAARIGGNADVLIVADSSTQLAETVKELWVAATPFIILGSGSNVLVSDAGVREVVILNKAKQTRFNLGKEPPTVWVESGVNLGNLARLAATKGLSGFEWAAGIPGTVGGAVYGNAGAHGSNIADNLVVANILQLNHQTNAGKHDILQQEWSVEHFEYTYRSSLIKRQPGRVVVLSAEFKFEKSTPDAVKKKMDEFKNVRQNSQPPGASLGSIFKNPTDDYAGRLIEAAGLKGASLGNVEISRKHANFFINRERASASEYAGLIKLAQQTVMDKFGVRLELEIELIGDWPGN